MLSESSKKLKLYKLVNLETGDEESRSYMLEKEVDSKNRGYQMNSSPKRYVLVETAVVSKLSK